MNMLLFDNSHHHEGASMNVERESPGVSSFVGTPKQAQARLGKSHADQVLVVEIERISTSKMQALAENIAVVASSMFDALQVRQDRVLLEQLANALVPRKPVSPRLIREAAMLVQARKAVLSSGDWLTAAQIAELAGLSATNPSAQPNKWKKQGQIFAIHHNGVDYFPGFGLARNANFRPVKALAKVIDVFAGHKDGWGMAYWFMSVSSLLGGQRPRDLLVSAPERVIDAARDEVLGAVHG